MALGRGILLGWTVLIVISGSLALRMHSVGPASLSGSTTTKDGANGRIVVARPSLPVSPLYNALNLLLGIQEEAAREATAGSESNQERTGLQLLQSFRLHIMLSETRMLLDAAASDRRARGARRLARAFCDRRFRSATAPVPRLICQADELARATYQPHEVEMVPPPGRIEKVGFQYLFGDVTKTRQFLDLCIHSLIDPEYLGNVVFRQAMEGALMDDHWISRSRQILLVYHQFEGKTVASVGCGLGTLLPWFKQAVGKRGTVWAEDIDTNVMNFLYYARSHGLPELGDMHIVLGTREDANLPKNTMDVIFLVHSVHCMYDDHPTREAWNTTLKWLLSMRSSLKSDGKIVIVEDSRILSHSNLQRLLETAGMREESCAQADGISRATREIYRGAVGQPDDPVWNHETTGYAVRFGLSPD